MKIIVATLAACLAAALVPAAGLAATPAQEQAFVDTYRKAFEGKDAKTLHSLMYTEGADPKALGFYRMMTTVGMGSKVASIALVDLTAEDRERADRTMPSPDGKVAQAFAQAGEEARDPRRDEDRGLVVDRHERGVRRRARREAVDPGAGARQMKPVSDTVSDTAGR